MEVIKQDDMDFNELRDYIVNKDPISKVILEILSKL